MKTADDLRKELADAVKAEAKEGEDALMALRHVKVYTVTWKSEFLFYCSRQLDEESVAGYLAWKEKYPKHSGGFRFEYDGKKREGMEYVLIANYLVQVSGGTLVLKATDDKDSFSHNPKLLTSEQVAALKAGVVPEELKNG
jgi:hypothetical protein